MDVKASIRLAHHCLRVYWEARRLTALVHRRSPQHAELRAQAQRACISVVLNVAEGAALQGAAKKRHYRIARGSVLETVACYEIASDIGERVPVREVTELGRAVASMLAGLIRRN